MKSIPGGEVENISTRDGTGAALFKNCFDLVDDNKTS